MTGRRIGGAETANGQEISLATRAAWLSFIGGHTQGEIAKRLRVSPAKAHRLIALAQKRGLVKVFIEGAPAECIALEDALTKIFGLDNCVVAPELGHDAAGEFAAVAAAGARFLHHLLQASAPLVVGVGKGRTLAATVEHMPSLNRPDLKFVSVSGSLTRNLAANPFDVVQRLVEKTGGEGYFLPVPYLAGSVAEKRVLQAQDSVKRLLSLARGAELFVIGLGAMDANAHVKQTGMVTPAEWRELQRLGAVGDLMGSFLDIHGRPVPAPVNRLSVGLTLDQLRGRRVVVLAGGAYKAAAMLAALGTGVITDLILDEPAARRLIGLAERRPAAPPQGAQGASCEDGSAGRAA